MFYIPIIPYHSSYILVINVGVYILLEVLVLSILNVLLPQIDVVVRRSSVEVGKLLLLVLIIHN